MKIKLLKTLFSLICFFGVINLHAEDAIDIEQAYIGLIIKITSMSDDIKSLQAKYELLSGEKINTGIDLEKAFYDLKKRVEALNSDILSLKEQNESLIEKQRINSKKISELFEMLELKINKETTKESGADNRKSDAAAEKIYDDARRLLLNGENENAINLFLNYLNDYKGYTNYANAMYWLGRAYSSNKSYLEAKEVFLKFQNENPQHAKFANSMYDLANAHLELNELESAKNTLSKMLKKFPDHNLSLKAKQKLTEIQ